VALATPQPPTLPRFPVAEAPSDKQPAGPLWISAAEAAAHLGMTIEALKARAREGRLGFREGGRWRFSLADLQRYAETIEHRHTRRFPRR
jgi:hypothetical protein